MPRISVFDKELFLYVPVLHTQGGRICPYVVADGKFTKLVTAYFSIQSDLMETQAMIIYFKENPDIPGVVKAAMFKAFIIQYAKCFTKAWGRVTKLFQLKTDLNNQSHLHPVVFSWLANHQIPTQVNFDGPAFATIFSTE